MNPDDQSKIPTTPLTVLGAGGAPPDDPLTDSAIGAALGAGGSKPPGNPGQWQPPSPEELQRDFPQYEIRGILGRGGMGAVYKGWQKRLDRFVAIKILPPGMDDGVSDFTERFKREAKAMANLHHPGIVAVYDAGETAGGLLYFVMECVEGTDVQRLVSEHKRLNPAEALRIASDVCEALAYAHAHGVIHRDIKPSNIMLDGHGTVKVADFGLAKSTAPGTTSLTVSNVTMGTPDFMAPETLHGVANADHRADIYAVGVMIYQMLTGKLPRGKYDPASHIVPGLGRRLDRIVDRALQPNPAARYSSAAELRTAVEPVMRSIIRRAAANGGASGSRKMPALILLAAVVLAAAVTALVHFSPWKKHGENGGTHPIVPPISAGDGPGEMEDADHQKTTENPGGKAAPPIATKDAPFVNTLGQEFVPVPGTPVLFCRWETRMRDYAAYAWTNDVNDAWATQDKDGVPLGRDPEYPVSGVSWDDAKGFCEWLTKKEAAEGKLPKGMKYRLPTDEEWSRAVGLKDEEGSTPKEKSGKNQVDYPWGTGFPPPKDRVGNYADSAYHEKFPKERDKWIEGYTDGFATTAPVGSFAANAYGIHDLGGNVWEWCEDLFEPAGTQRVVRGASWGHFDRDGLLSSYRRAMAPASRTSNYGFRCVLEVAAR